MALHPGSIIEFQAFLPITRARLKAYSDASGDFNPIHLDEEVAKKAGLPGIIAHGMLIAGLIADRALRYIADDESLQGFELIQFQTRFKAMTLLGDTPFIGGSVKDVSDQGFVLELQAKNQKGELTTVGTARFKKKVSN